MARRGQNDIGVGIIGEADFGRARKDAARALDRIEKDAKETTKDIERAFDRVELSPELDSTEIRQALNLADQLDGMVAQFTVDTDLEEIKQAEKIARSLRAFQGRVDISVEGRQELKDALDLAEKMDQIRSVKVQVQGQQDLKRALDLADDLERKRTVPIDARAGDLVRLDEQITEAGEAGAEGIADAIGGIDYDNIGGEALSKLTGALGKAGPWGAVAAGIGVVFGDELIAGITAGFSRRRNAVIRGIQTAASPEELAVAGAAAGEAWSAGFGESMGQLKSDADQLVSILGDMVDDADMGELLKQSQVLADLLGVDVTQAAILAGRTVRQGLADDWQDAFDDMIGVTQEFGTTGVEALDILEEFGTNFSKFEIDGGRAVQFVASAFRDGLVPTMDRAGELWEELVTRITDADSADAINQLVGDFERVQESIARGGEEGRLAAIEVVSALADVESQSEQAALANVIFGASFEQVAEKGEFLDRILGLLNDQTDAYAGKASEVTAALEEQTTSWERLKRGVTDAGAVFGEEVLAREVDLLFDFKDATDEAGDAVVRFLFQLPEADDEIGKMSSGLLKASGGAEELAEESEELADSLDEVEFSASDLRDALKRLFDFEADQLMRDIAEAGDDLAESFDDGAAATVGLGGSINITTEEGRRLQSQFERLSQAAIENNVAYANNEIEASELAAAQAAVRAEFDRVTGAAELTTEQVEALRRKYIDVAGIDSIETVFTADTLQAIAALDNLANKIGRIPRSVRTTVSSGFLAANRASGGETTGLTLVGEEGPELLDFGDSTAFVHNAGDTSRILAGSPAARSFAQAPSARSSGGGTTTTVLDIRSGGTALDDLLVEVLRKAISNRGGGVVAVVG